MKNRLPKSYAKYLGVAAGLMIIFCPGISNGQEITMDCGLKMRWVYEKEYDGQTGTYQFMHVYRYRYGCDPVIAEAETKRLPNQTTRVKSNTVDVNTNKDKVSVFDERKGDTDNSLASLSRPEPLETRDRISYGESAAALSLMKFQGVVLVGEKTFIPAEGYQWVNKNDPNDMRVEPKPGLSQIAPGLLRPNRGYQWVKPNDSKDLNIKPKLGLVEPIPGTLRPATGYRWSDRNNPKDFRVEKKP